MQEGMLFHALHEREGGSVIPYLLELAFDIEGPLDVDCFERSWNRLIARHEALRSVFNYTAAERPLQIVLKSRRITLFRRDLTAWSGDRKRRFIDDYRRAQRETPFDLTRDLLMRVAVFQLEPHRHRVVWLFHHITMDGWCMNILQREMFAIYAALLAGHEAKLPMPARHRDFARWLQGRNRDAALDFWRETLDGYEKPVGPAGWREASLRSWGELRHETFVLDAGQTAALRAAGALRNATLNHVFQAAWGVLLARHNRSDDVVFGSVVAGRPHDIAGIDGFVGLCMNTIPQRLRIDDAATMQSMIEQARDASLASQDHQTVGLADIQARSAPKRELINHILVFESYPTDVRFEGARIEPVPGLVIDAIESAMPSNYAFQIAVFPSAETRVVLTCRDGAFDARQMARSARHLQRILEAIVADASTPAAAIDLLDAGERAELLLGAAAETPLAEGCDGPTISDRIEQLLATSKGIAVSSAGESLTWNELEAQSRVLAAQLTPGTRVAVSLAPTPQLIVALFAVIRRGATFIPIDPSNPAERTEHILSDSGAATLIDPDGVHERNIEHASTPSAEAAYILYTSGTTGRPKGVQIGGEALLNYTDWLRRRFDLSAADRSLLVSSHAYDLGYTALFGSLLNGGALHLASEDERRSAEAIVDLVADRRITFLKLTPSLLRIIVGAANAQRLSGAHALRLVFIGGERYAPADLAALHRLAPHIRIRNHYGPTESCIGCISGDLHPDDADVIGGRQVLGRPIDGALVYVLDARGDLAPIGIPGELAVGGRGLALGYTNPDHDRGRFTPARWDPSLRLYRTGDLAERRDDGSFVFLGRADDQIKLRGYRVEPAEIEAALRRTPPLRDAVVLPLPGPDGQPELAAFVLCETDELDASALRARLGQLLPEFMIPGQFIPVSRFPTTGNGKIDRRALAGHQRVVRRASGGEVRSETERSIRDIWQAVLAVENIGPDDNFFDLGGHSVKAILVLSRVMKQLGVKLEVRDFFEYPTVRALARRVEDGRAPRRELSLRLKEGGTGAPPIFFLPPVIGTSTIYKQVLEALDTDVTAWGLQCPGFDDNDPFLQTFEELALVFTNEIRRRQPRGPYLVCGYSMGVISALEVASRLESAGERVSLILIDGNPDRGGEPFENIDELRDSPAWSRLIAILGANLDADEMARITRLADHNLRLLARHRASVKLAADIFCIEAAANAPRAGMSSIRTLTSGAFHHRTTRGDHYSLFHPQSSQALLANLTEGIATVTSGAGVHPRLIESTARPPRTPVLNSTKERAGSRT